MDAGVPLWGVVLLCVVCAAAGGAIVAVVVGGATEDAHARGYRRGFADGTGWDDLDVEDRDAG